ncbi:MAG: bifunctional hydroxymethylpyrimidine kinase/phosphomethylpyrimidine kinase, partial [Nitrospirae bacterium]|nr:bifunctional hydroxymethylpyrimidine kinase/phosphomethylpyrimidine kinase [Nitrospirota bacterium]
GQSIYADETIQFMELFSKNIAKGDFIVISGSAIGGISPQFYADLVKRAKFFGCFVIVDLKEDNLYSAISALPDIVKVNKSEFENFLGYSINNLTDLKTNAIKLIEKGIKGIIITDGGVDVFGCTSQGSWSLTPPKVKVINTWGSGDCVAAGIAYGLSIGKTFIEALKLGVACGTANTLVYGAGFIEIEDVNRLIDKVNVLTNYK